MTTSKTLFISFLTVFFSLLSPPEIEAVRPLFAPIATVAGDESQPGFRDGSFDTAFFNVPLGLAVSNDGTRLFVADSGNHRIRIIHLDQNNEVTTLAGQDRAGKLDGPVTVAQFNDPRGVLCLPDDRLVVNDFGNKLLRLVYLKAGTVTTFAGGSPKPAAATSPSATATPSDLPKEQVSMDGVVAMAFMARANSIFFTQPDSGTLKALDLGTGLVSVVLNNNTQIPHPSALWCQGSTLYLADRDLPAVFRMDWKGKAPVTLLPAGTPLDKVLALCTSDNILYGRLASKGFPAERFITDRRYTQFSDPSNQPVTFRNGWGDTLPADKYFKDAVQSNAPFAPWMGFIPDPSDKRKFFVSESESHMIISYRDLFQTRDYNSNGVFAPEYPAPKPKNTYRIFIVGDSRSVEAQPFPFPSERHPLTHPPDTPEWSQNLILAPSIERELNFQAALEDVPWNYEVLTFGKHSDFFLWPTYELPEAVQRNDVDLVIIFSPNMDGMAYERYFDHPLTSDGIPKFPPDMEYLMKPPLDRIPDGLPRKFYDYCKAHHLVNVVGNNLVFDGSVMTIPEIHDWILEFYGRPWDVLNRKLAGMKTSSGKPPRLLILFTYTGREGSQKYWPAFREEVANKYHVPYLDIGPVMNALHLSYYPLTGDDTHLNPDGCVFFGKLLAHELAKEKLIPWKEEPGKKNQ